MAQPLKMYQEIMIRVTSKLMIDPLLAQAQDKPNNLIKYGLINTMRDIVMGNYQLINQ